MSDKGSPLLALPGAVQASWPDEGVAAHYGDPAREQRALDGASDYSRTCRPSSSG